jgi:SSS family solute:Na+ symporter
LLLASIIFYLLITIGIGYWASKRVKDSDDYMLAGRSLPLALSSAALFATWFGSETIFGASSEFLKGGLFAVIEDPFGAALCLLLFGLFITRKLYAMKLLTLGDFFKVRYGKTTEVIAGIFFVPSYIGYIAAQLVAMGLVINVVTGIEIWEGIVISACVVTFYTYIGGMWAISITDFIQSILIVLGMVVLAVVLADQAGGVESVWNNVQPKDLQFLPKAKFNDIVAYVAAWSVLGLGSIPSQDVFQRVMSSGSEKTAVRSCYIAAGLYLTVALIPLFISLCTKILYPAEVAGDTQLALPKMVLLHTSVPVQILFFGSLLSAIMSTTSSAMLAPAAIFSENLVKPFLKTKMSDKGFLLLTRLSVLFFSIVATVMACLRQDIYELVSSSSVFSLVSIFASMILGLYWSKSTAAGAISSMFTGMISWYYFSRVESEIPAFVPGTLVSIATMVIVSLITNRKPKASRD